MLSVFKPLYTKLFLLGERYIYSPSPLAKILAIFLLPLSILWSLGILIKKALSKKQKTVPPLPTISIGNLTLGGSGKTPLCVAISSSISGACIILRGYKRKTKGLIVVSHNGKLLSDIDSSADEAMLYAMLVKDATVIVSEDRIKAIKKAKSLGARYALLDDGFGKFNIQKLDILINPSHPPALPFCLPSGGYRYPPSFIKYADCVVQGGREFKSMSYIKNASKSMVLVSAIANPARLSEFFSQTVGQVFFPDHYDFSKAELERILDKFGATSLLVTQKDYVKIVDFGLNVSIIEQHTILCSDFVECLENFISKGML